MIDIVSIRYCICVDCGDEFEVTEPTLRCPVCECAHEMQKEIDALKAQLAMPIAVYNALMASLAIMRDECGTTPGEVSAREWLRARGKIVAAAKAGEVDE